tara:strand:+ start:193 stop:591 length:399 start_codon:yes stop_codon:yes gene_type:complete
MILENIIRKHLLLEKKIREIKSNLTITYNLHTDERGHTENRKFRHVGSGGDKIYDYDIINFIELAKDDITFHIVNEQITSGIRFIVSEKKFPFLNVIIEPIMKNPYEWNLTIITIMRKEFFDIGRGQLQIFV